MSISKKSIGKRLCVIFTMLLVMSASLFAANAGDHIIYIDVLLEKDMANGDCTAILEDIMVTAGTVKDESEGSALPGENDLICSFITNAGIVTHTIHVDNPLTQRYDYTRDDYETLYTLTYYAEQASLSVRAPYTADMAEVRIEVATADRGRVELLTIDIAPVVIEAFAQSQELRESFEVVKIIDNGSNDDLINFVILGDGYTENEQSKFINDAQAMADYIYTQKPYPEYRDYFNVYAVKVVSNVTGAALSPNNLIDNYFGSTFGYGGIDRLLVPTKSEEVYDVLENHTPFYDQCIVIVNTTKYGGSGGRFATSSMNSSASEILVHEIGHSFVDLIDEYWAGAGYAREGINMTQDTNPATVRWKAFLNQEGIGIYPHSESPTWHRPHQNCKMRYLSRDFCLVCRDAHAKKIESLVTIIVTPTPTTTATPSLTPTATVTPTPTMIPTATPIFINVAKNKPVYASGDFAPEFGKGNAIDGNETTVWGSKYNAGPQWLFVDLGTETFIDYATVKFFNPYYAPVYYIGVSNDLKTWTFAAEEHNGDGGDDTLPVNERARYIGIYLTKGAMKVYGIKEFEAYTVVEPATPVPTTPTPTPTGVTGYPGFEVNVAYNIGDRICYDGYIWECVVAHTSNIGWYPGAPGVFIWKKTDIPCYIRCLECE